MQEKNTLGQHPAFYMVDPETIMSRFDAIEQRLAEIKSPSAKFVTVKEAAALLKMSEAAVRRACEEGALPAKNFAPKGATNAQWRVKISEI